MRSRILKSHCVMAATQGAIPAPPVTEQKMFGPQGGLLAQCANLPSPANFAERDSALQTQSYTMLYPFTFFANLLHETLV